MNILKMLPVSYYKRAYENNLIMVGVEDGMPQWLGTDVNWTNFEKNNRTNMKEQ